MASLPPEELQTNTELRDTPFSLDQPFHWATCSEQDILPRVFIKQRAVNNALKYASSICHDLMLSGEDNMSLDVERPDIRCGRGLRAWKDDIGLFTFPERV